jgi:HEAT repeat protein
MDAVRPLVDSNDPDLQVQAIKIMGMGFGSEETTEILNPKLHSSDTRVRKEALNAYLPYIGPENYKTVLEMIWDKDETIRRNALAYAQQFIDDSDHPLLEKALQHEDEAIRKSVSQILN